MNIDLRKPQLSNKDVYASNAFDYWANRAKSDLFPAERYIIKKYLTNKSGTVLEAGTGAGRIAFNIEKMGFHHITAFDFVPELVNKAREAAQELGSKINFKTGNAVELKEYPDDHFDYLVYLQQVICFIPRNQIPVALKESFRIAKRGAVALFSFLNWNGRFYNPALSLAVNTFRMFRHESTSKQTLPWLNFGQGLNWKFLTKNQATNYWMRRAEICDLLQSAGFNILECSTQNEMGIGSSPKGHIYIACQKPWS